MKKKLALGFFAAVFISFIGFSHSGEAFVGGTWIVYNTENSGIVSNDIRAIGMDTLGNMWIGTANGLSKFNGVTWTNYTTADKLAHNTVNAIAYEKGPNGDELWVGTQGGVSEIGVTAAAVTFSNPYTMANPNYPGMISNAISSAAVDNQHIRWFGSDSGLMSFDGSAWKSYTTANNLANNQVTSIAFEETSFGPEIWVGTAGGISVVNTQIDAVTFATPYTTTNPNYPGMISNDIQSATVDLIHNIRWFGSKKGVMGFGNSQFQSFTTNDFLPDNDVTCAAVGIDGMVYFGTRNGGVSRFDGVSGASPLDTSWSNISSNSIRAIAVAKSGVLWFGTDQGVTKWIPPGPRGNADFNGDGIVSLSDLVILGSMWGLISTDVNFNPKYDLNGDGSIGLGDLVILGGQWTGSGKAAKAVPAGVSLAMTVDGDEANSMLSVKVSAKDAAGIHGVAFSLKYNANLLEFVKDSVTGLGQVSVTNEKTAGVIDIASVYQNEQFRGIITLGFKYKDRTSDLNIEMVNTEVALNGVVGSVDDQTVVLKALPKVYTLSQNSPNPFNPTTTIQFAIPGEQEVAVRLNIYDIRGGLVRTLVDGVRNPGIYDTTWNGMDAAGRKISSGIYIYRLEAGSFTQTRKMMLLR
jgi:hypothetical protein